MPEGPEVRRYALQLQNALETHEILHFSARNKAAKAYLLAHPGALVGRKIEKIRSHGKHLYGVFEGEIGFHSHLMTWGRWFVHEIAGTAHDSLEIDRRERARLVVPSAVAVLFSAPVFEIFEGHPYEQIENLRTLGPDVLPYDGVFESENFVARLTQNENLEREIGAVLLDQRVCAGIGNYFRADLLFLCGISPFKTVRELSGEEIAALTREIPLLAARSLEQPGVSVPPEMRARLLSEPQLSYNERIVEWGARHATFRRTNLPCLRCGEKIKQKKQVVYRTPDGDAENEKSRVIYFCPNCQK